MYKSYFLVTDVFILHISLFVPTGCPLSLLYFGLFFSDPIFLCAIIPIKIYSNAEAYKGKILIDNKGKSGIYMFQNFLIAGVLIGKSVEVLDLNTNEKNNLCFRSPSSQGYKKQKQNKKKTKTNS